MALTRKLLRSMGIEDEKIEQIIEEHTGTVNRLKDELDQYREDAEALPGVREELDALKAKGDGGYREKYEKEHEEFEAFKAETEKEGAEREKRTLYRRLLQDAGIDPKRLDAVLKVSDLSGVEVKDGAIVDYDKLSESVKSEWADFIRREERAAEPPATPPKGEGDGKGEPRSLREAMHDRYDHRD